MKPWIIFALGLGLLCLVGCGASQSAPGGTAATASLSYHSFDGGGAHYECELADPSLVAVESERRYGKADHAQLDGAAYDLVFSFTGLRPGETELTVRGSSPLYEVEEERYRVTVDEALNVTLTRIETPETPAPETRIDAVAVMEIGEQLYYAVPADGPAVAAFAEALSPGPVELELRRTDSLGLAGTLPWPFTPQEEPVDVVPGFLVLRGTEELLLCTEAGETGGAVLADFGYLPPDLLEAEALPIRLWLEWSE